MVAAGVDERGIMRGVTAVLIVAAVCEYAVVAVFVWLATEVLMFESQTPAWHWRVAAALWPIAIPMYVASFVWHAHRLNWFRD